jgi:hypothetical protein
MVANRVVHVACHPRPLLGHGQFPDACEQAVALLPPSAGLQRGRSHPESEACAKKEGGDLGHDRHDICRGQPHHDGHPDAPQHDHRRGGDRHAVHERDSREADQADREVRPS